MGRIPFAARAVGGLMMCGLVDGCSSGSGGGGSGGAADPLPQFQLGNDPNFDASIANVSRSIDGVLSCMNARSQTEQQTLDELKNEYVQIAAPAAPFDEFVMTAESALANIQEVCATIQQLTVVDNRSLACFASDQQLNDADNFRALRSGYLRSGGIMRTFVEFTSEFAQAENAKSEQICGAVLGADEELDGLVARLTVSVNRRAECTGNATRATDADTLRVLQAGYFTSAGDQTFVAYTRQTVQTHEGNTDQQCRS